MELSEKDINTIVVALYNKLKLHSGGAFQGASRSRELGEITTKLDILLEFVKEVQLDIKQVKIDTIEWQEKHSGQGEDTTHAEVNRKLAEHERKFNMLIGMGVLISFLGVGNIIAFLFWWFSEKGAP